MKELVWEEKPTGVLGFYEGQAIAWCAFAPREDFIKLESSRVHKRIDDKSVWSIPCFFIDKNFRRQGVSVQLLNGVIKYAKETGIKIIEAYPAQKFVLLGDDSQKDTDIYTSIVEHFPQNVYCVYIRRVGTPEKPHVLLKQQIVQQKGIHFCYFAHSEDAILHSKSIGLIK